jgi:ribosomal protein S18 acetylase RimI-like enzyme
MIIIKRLQELTQQETNSIQSLIHSCFHYKSRLHTYDTVLYQTDDDNIIGFIGLHTNKYTHTDTQQDISVLNQVCVAVDYRNQGIASYMLRMLKEIYKKTQFILYIDKGEATTDALYNFYQKRGFDEVPPELIKTANIPYDENIEYVMITLPTKHTP